MLRSKKTTILFPPELHDRLTRLASERGTSLGHLVGEACEARYGVVMEDERVAAVAELGGLSLPVAVPAVLEHESVPGPEDLLPPRRRRRRSASG